MKNFRILITIFMLNTLVYCQESGCLIDEDEPRIAVGEKIDIEGLCQTITCISDNNLIIETCPELTAAPLGPGFHVEQHFDKAFPNCCPVYEPNMDKLGMDNNVINTEEDQIENEKS